VLWVNTCAEKSSSDDSPIYTVTYAIVRRYSSSSFSTMRSEGHMEPVRLIGIVEVLSCSMVQYIPKADGCICILESCFPVKVWIFILGAKTFVVLSSLGVGTLS
jgi:hypothetical protein